jgi:hypothetical protein
MQDPRRTQQLQGTGKAIQQGLLNIQESDKKFQDLFDKSFGDPKQPFKVTDKKALSQLAEMTQSGLLGMAEIGMFVGAGSKAFDKAMAFTATKLEKKGASPQEIWKETGTVRGPDGQWRQEINDAEAKFVTAPEMFDKAVLLKQGIAENKQKIKESKEYPDLFPKELTKAQKTLREENKANKELVDIYSGNQASFSGAPAKLAIEHPELYKAYPDLESVTVRQGTYNPNYLGTYEPKSNLLEVTKEGLKQDPRSTALHEMQHAIQEKEGFAVGGNVDTMSQLIAQSKYNLKDIERKIINQRDAASDEARMYIAKAQQEPEFKKFVDDAFDKYKTQLGEKSKDNPFGVDLQDAVQFQLLEQSPILKNYIEEANSLRGLANLDPYQGYRALMGEAEARLTQTRKDLTPEERRKYFPFEFQDKNLNPYGLDVPVNSLINLNERGNLVQSGLLGQ